MSARDLPWFEAFAEPFVRGFWTTVLAGTFPLPATLSRVQGKPLAAVLDDLLWTLEAPVAGRFGLCMKSADESGTWWRCGFQLGPAGWTLCEARTGATAVAGQEDLLATPHAQVFQPFLAYVTSTANRQARRPR